MSHPVFARVYAALAPLADRGEMADLRDQALAGARGRLLMVGLGPGVDLDHLPPTVTDVVAVEPDPTMRRIAARRAARAGVPVSLLPDAGESLPLPTASVDTALLAYVLCSVQDPSRVLQEVRRVLRPEGTVHLLEHVRAPDGTRLARWQDRLAGPWSRLAGGCRPNRRTRELAAAAGFDTTGLRDTRLHPNLPLVAPHLVGTAPARPPWTAQGDQ